MFVLLKNGTVYSPDYMGKKDMLFCFDKIALIERDINVSGLKDVQVIDCSNKYIFPGFIDLHIHITGGGGEGGFNTRTNEVQAEEILQNGITTVVGVLGADGVTRSVAQLYAKAKQLELNGLSTYIFTGSYQVPVITLTGSIQSDMLFVDKVIGVGEISLSDNRAFAPTFDEISRIAAQTRNGAMISGKPGLVHFHIGEGDAGIEYLFRLIKETLIPKSHFLPTHVNRTGKLFEQAIEYMNQGGYVDITAGFIPTKDDPDCIATYDALKKLIDINADIGKVTMTSDANGSVPVFDDNGNVISSDTVSCKILFDEIKTAIIQSGIPIELALSVITKNPAERLGLIKRKGTLEVGKDADCVICDKDLKIAGVFSKGQRY